MQRRAELPGRLQAARGVYLGLLGSSLLGRLGLRLGRKGKGDNERCGVSGGNSMQGTGAGSRRLAGGAQGECVLGGSARPRPGPPPASTPPPPRAWVRPASASRQPWGGAAGRSPVFRPSRLRRGEGRALSRDTACNSDGREAGIAAFWARRDAVPAGQFVIGLSLAAARGERSSAYSLPHRLSLAMAAYGTTPDARLPKWPACSWHLLLCLCRERTRHLRQLPLLQVGQHAAAVVRGAGHRPGRGTASLSHGQSTRIRREHRSGAKLSRTAFRSRP